PEVLLRNVYLEPFHAAQQAGVGSFMSAYMDLNDVPATGNRWLMHNVLREEWGFRGFVVSDAFAVGSLVTHGYARDPEDAAYKALSAGVSMDMASSTLIAQVPKLVASGKITQAQLDDAVRPILEAKIKLGLFEQPYVDEAKVESVLNRDSSRTLARSAASRSIVLLRNENHALPLTGSETKVAVIGPLADSPRDMEGGWTVEGLFGGEPKSHTVTVLEALRKRLPNSQIESVPGPPLQRLYSSFIDSLMHKPRRPEPSSDEIRQWIERSGESSRRADLVIAVMGEAANMSGEGASRATLDLPGIQQQMLEAAVASGKPVVLVLVSGRPLEIHWANEHVPAILQAWYPGSEGGNAITDVLFGDVNPGGKLPISWPRSSGQEPLYYNHNLTHEPEDRPNFASRYWDVLSKPLYPFGYGLSYTNFEFKNVRLSRSAIKSNEITEVLVDVTNTGSRSGDAVAQVYIHQRAGSASRPVRELKGFQRVPLAPKEIRTLKFPLGPGELKFWSPETRQWGVEPGIFDVWVGDDSTTTLHAEFEVTD
ncbi:MAG TPA: glycoside hydrolase family 3 C-terminal domain-containing protein, partial [Terriglobales bacterium]|nr:glycoside hydrolase family 3 C-terminal domain-containing protein [Terriglobales bacterium]